MGITDAAMLQEAAAKLAALHEQEREGSAEVAARLVAIGDRSRAVNRRR